MATTTVNTGYGPTRKTRKSAQREADAWTNNHNTEPYTFRAMHGKPSYTETIVTEVQETGPTVQSLKTIDRLQDEINENLEEGEV